MGMINLRKFKFATCQNSCEDQNDENLGYLCEDNLPVEPLN